MRLTQNFATEKLHYIKKSWEWPMSYKVWQPEWKGFIKCDIERSIFKFC